MISRESELTRWPLWQAAGRGAAGAQRRLVPYGKGVNLNWASAPSPVVHGQTACRRIFAL